MPMARNMYAACSVLPASCRRISPKPRCAAKRAYPSTASSWWRGPRPRCRGPLLLAGDRPRTPNPPAGAVYPLVRQPRLQAGRSVLLIAPTGGGKTLAGFLPSLVELSEAQSRSSPLARSAPSPLVGEGGVRGSRGDEKASTLAPDLPTPTPTPPHKGEGRSGASSPQAAASAAREGCTRFTSRRSR